MLFCWTAVCSPSSRSFPNFFKEYVKGCGVNGFKAVLCSLRFMGIHVKKDKDRAPVIQSCVYTEIHDILTLTSLWRWQRHALILNFLFFLSFLIIMGVNAISCFVLSSQNVVIETSSPSIRQLSKNTYLYFGVIMCGMTFWWVIIVSALCSGVPCGFEPCGFQWNIPISVFKANKKTKENLFLAINSFFALKKKFHM